MDAFEVAERLDAKPVGNGWQCRCPAHDDHRASLSIGCGDDGRVLLHCHTGCALDAVLAAAGLTLQDIFPDAPHTKTRKTITATYDYHDEAGTLLYQNVRYEPKDFKQRRPDGLGGWIWNTKGVRKVLFGLPELTNELVVYMPEGEKDVRALRAIGFVATCNIGGGGKGKWHDDYVEQLQAAGITHVVVLPDNDDVGHEHAETIAASCHRAGLHVKVVTLPGLPPKGDVSDYLDEGHSRDDLKMLVRQAPVYPSTSTTPAATSASTGPRRGRHICTILHDVQAYLKKYVVLTDAQATIISLWVAHTHALDATDATPYLHVSSPEPECGKTRLAEILEQIVRCPWRTDYTTKASLVRKVDRLQPTLLLDELDAALKGNPEYVEALRGILNSGYLRSGFYSMCVGGGGNFTDKDFHTFCPKLLAGIGVLPRTVASRSIPITLKRRAKHEPVSKWRDREGRTDAAPIRDALVAWAPGAVGSLSKSRPDFPPGLRDRSEDVLEPLLAIADLAGDDWPDRARKAALLLVGHEKAEDDSTGVQLLGDIQQVFKAHGDPQVLSSKEIRDALSVMEDRPWATWGKSEKPITGHALARILRSFEVVSAGDVRIGDKVAKSYRRTAFLDAWSRYVPNPANPDSEAQHRNNANRCGAQVPFSEAQHDDHVADAKTAVSPITTNSCCDVADENPNPESFEDGNLF